MGEQLEGDGKPIGEKHKVATFVGARPDEGTSGR
jgi:hypothetical protein